MVLDAVGGDTLDRSWRVLRRGGMLVTVAGSVSEEVAAGHGVRAVFFVVEPNRDELIEIARLIDGGHVRPIIADILPLERAREAFERGLGGHTRGKLVLAVTA